MHAADNAEFAAAIAPLERKAGRPLNGPGHAKCFAAFASHPDAFKALAADALKRGRNPLGLLIRMIDAGEHLAVAEMGAKSGGLENAIRWAKDVAPRLDVDQRADVVARNPWRLTDVERAVLDEVLVQQLERQRPAA